LIEESANGTRTKSRSPLSENDQYFRERVVIRPQTTPRTQLTSTKHVTPVASRGELENAHSTLIECAERELFTRPIQLAQSTQAKAARWLGISRFNAQKLTRLDLHPTRGEPEA
jgi:hypothetical protein